MKTLARSANRDLFLVAGQFAMADGRIAQAHIIQAAILTVKCELQYDTERGIPYFDTIFEHPNNIGLWRAYVIDRVRGFEWVKDIIDFTHELDYTNKTVRYTMQVSTTDGLVTINGIDYNISTIGTHGGGGGQMESLIQNGIFYLPVFKDGEIQVYRQLKQFVLPEGGGVTTDVSEQTYVKNEDGIFVKRD